MDPVIEVLALELVSEGRFVAPHGAMAVGSNVFGGQILAQLAFAAQRTMSDHPLTSMHAIFPRPARVDAPLYIDIDVIRHGRNATLLQATLHQGESPCATALCAGLAPQDIDAEHSLTSGDVEPPAHAQPLPSSAAMGLEVRVAGGVDLSDPGGGHRAAVDLWIKAPTECRVDLAGLRAFIAYAGEIWFAATALRPVEGLSQAQLMSELIPAVLSHNLAYHFVEPAPTDWLLLRVESPVLRGGRVYGQGTVFDEAGGLLASISQENLFRTPRSEPSAG